MPVVTTFTRRLTGCLDITVNLTLALTAEERSRSRYRLEAADRQVVVLQLPRGTVLRDGDLLQSEPDGLVGRVIAKPEPVLTIQAEATLDLLQAAYHLGNRHVPLEIAPTYLRLSPDPVLQDMLQPRLTGR